MERRISVFFPLLLIAAGLIGIMIQFGTIQSSSLWALVYIWPLFLIAAGLGLILRGYWKYLTVVFDILVVGGAFLAVLFAPQLGWNRAPDYVITGNGISIGSSERGSGKIITQSRQIPEFTKIRISYPAQVTVSQGGTESLTIEADDNVAGEIRTQVVDGELDINQVHNHQFIISPTRSPKITIVVKDLTELDFESAGSVVINGLKTDNMKVIMNGAGSLTLNNVQFKSLVCGLNGVGSVQASGTTDLVNVHLQGLGSFNGSELHSQTATVNLDGMGNATIWVDNSLKADVSGMGSVNYYGNAQVDKTVDGLGGVKYLGNK